MAFFIWGFRKDGRLSISFLTEDIEEEGHASMHGLLCSPRTSICAYDLAMIMDYLH